MNLLAIGVQILLGLFFTPEGVIKWTHIGPSTARFTHFRYPQWFRYVTGVVEVLVGMGLLVGLWFSGIAALAAVVLVVEMLIAIYSHLVRGKDAFVPDVVPAAVFLLLALLVVAIRWGNLIALAR
ncbi:MAG TPA: DoxX family protein [Ktedonobacteraceae bacterium]|nr:DoxX family protein [Ktedonobacteraceae bacterium]